MCGIVGIVNADGKPVDKIALAKMNEILQHRGPDSSGLYIDGNVGLGHRRLSIIDLSVEAGQPMRYQDSPYWIVFNGEIYNYIEIKDELRSKGYCFKTSSDTEVALSAYIEWGESCFKKFNGMWGIAIYNSISREIILSRDRFGVKPIYYYVDRSKFVFASEKKAIILSDFYDLKFDAKGLKTSIHDPFLLEASGKTEFEGIRSLLPGHFLRLRDGKVSIYQWWRLDDNLDKEVPATFDERCEKFRYLFENSCRLRLRSDVPIATSLSGGLDSSSVVAMLSRIEKNRYRAFVHSFKESDFDETEYANIVGESTTTPISYVENWSSGLSEQIDKIIYYFESVYGGMPDGAYRIYNLQHAHGYKISIDGHGADEMLAGYSWYLDEMLKDVSLLNVTRIKDIVLLKKEITANKKARSGTNIPRLIYHRLPDTLKRLIYEQFSSKDDGDLYCPRQQSYAENSTHLKRRLINDFNQAVLPRILKNFDSMSMANSIEVRMPFLDHRLVSYSFALPDTDLIDKGWTKFILRKSMDGLLDRRVVWRKDKKGFNSPVDELLSAELKDWALDTIRQHNGELFNSSDLENDFYEKIINNKKWDDALDIWKKINAIRLVHIYKEKKKYA